MRLSTPLSLLLGLSMACDGGDDPGVDAGPELDATVDASVPDAQPPDTGPGDAGPFPELPDRFNVQSCADCAGGCSGEDCLRSQSGETFCADRCDADLEACLDGFTCFDVSGAMTSYFCIPPSATCVDSVGYGQRCVQDASHCAPKANHCEGDFHNVGYCTTRCDGASSCPTGFTCGLGDQGDPVCVATFLSPAEQCARDNLGTELPCAVDSDCWDQPGAVCVRSEPNLPGVCALPCNACDASSCMTTARGEVCLSDRCSCHRVRAPGQRDLLDEVLAQVGLTPCSTIFDVHSWTLLAPDIFDPYRLSFFDANHNEPLVGFEWAKSLVADLEGDAASGSPARRAARLVERMAELADAPAVRQPPEMIDMSNPLASAVADLITASGGTPNVATLQNDAADVPMELQLAVARVVEGITRATVARNNAMPSASVRASLYDFGPAFVARRRDGRGLDATSANVKVILEEQFGYDDMYGGAADLLDAIADADLGRFAGTPTATTATVAAFTFLQPTPIGQIGISDAENGIFEDAAAWALLVDVGGDDQYRNAAGGNVSEANAVSVLVDLGGSDLHAYVEVPDPNDGVGRRLPSDADGRYNPSNPPDQDNGPVSFSQTPRQGGARMGTAVLLDLGADDDEYRSLRFSQGSGVFGAGVLIDEGGNDTYLSEAVSQGAGSFGLGLLLDLDGDDRREAYTMSQGFAFARAVGVVVDGSGDDEYLLDSGDPSVGGDPLYFSAQRPGNANSSLGQGFGFGRRADFTDRAFMSGGVGILVDRSGADRYEGGIFAQGGGFWFGTGILADDSGNDTYDALWYGMATGAHYALGFLFDGAGDDVYGGTLPRVNVTIAGGHDYSAVFLVDESGDDQYLASRITLGSGNVNGMGFFVDNGGTDVYEVRSFYSIGNAGLLEGDGPGGARRKVNSLGVFIDAGDEIDTYRFENGDPLDGLGNDATWRQSQNDDPLVNEVELGTGVDGDGESTLHYP